MGCAKTDEPIEMSFGALTWVGPRNHVLGLMLGCMVSVMIRVSVRVRVSLWFRDTVRV